MRGGYVHLPILLHGARRTVWGDKKQRYTPRMKIVAFEDSNVPKFKLCAWAVKVVESFIYFPFAGSKVSISPTKLYLASQSSKVFQITLSSELCNVITERMVTKSSSSRRFLFFRFDSLENRAWSLVWRSIMNIWWRQGRDIQTTRFAQNVGASGEISSTRDGTLGG